MALGSFGTCGTRKREVRGSADSGEEGKRCTNALGTCGTKVCKVCGSAESNENGTIGLGELGTFGTKSSDRPEKNRLQVNQPIGEQRAQLNLGHVGQ
ncbi:hypothetical protein KI387_004752, partial [Taxus chinensis]